MPRKLACADFTFPLLTHDQSLKLISMLGFEGVDIGLFEKRSHLWPSREFQDVSRSARALATKVGDLGLKVADVFLQMEADFRPYAINHPEARRRRRAREWCLKALDYAQGCGCHHVTVLPGVAFDTESARDSYGRSVDELAWRVGQAGLRGLTLGTEAHVGSIVPRPRQAARLVHDVPGLTLTLDYTHFTRLGIADELVEPLIMHASHFHVRGARRGRLQTSFADNTIDYRRVVKALDRSGYKGWLGVEYVWVDWEHCNECDNVSETVRFRDFLRGIR
jgi:sugar phosphate isomerase/epimerase